jgi:hypothetical protein
MAETESKTACFGSLALAPADMANAPGYLAVAAPSAPPRHDRA